MTLTAWQSCMAEKWTDTGSPRDIGAKKAEFRHPGGGICAGPGAGFPHFFRTVKGTVAVRLDHRVGNAHTQ